MGVQTFLELADMHGPLLLTHLDCMNFPPVVQGHLVSGPMDYHPVVCFVEAFCLLELRLELCPEYLNSPESEGSLC